MLIFKNDEKFQWHTNSKTRQDMQFLETSDLWGENSNSSSPPHPIYNHFPTIFYSL